MVVVVVGANNHARLSLGARKLFNLTSAAGDDDDDDVGGGGSGGGGGSRLEPSQGLREAQSREYPLRLDAFICIAEQVSVCSKTG